MAGDWLKIEVCTPDKPEVIGIADMLGIAPAHAFGSLFLVWRWFDQHTTEGNASYVTKVTVDRLSGNAGFADAMVRVGWLIINEDGTVSLPNFGAHNGETAKQRGLTAKRVAKSKAKTNAKGNDGSATGALPREENRREEDKPINQPASAIDRFSIDTDWQPSDHVAGLAKQSGAPLSESDIPEFIAYWLTRPDECRTQAEWDKALMNSAKNRKLRGELVPSLQSSGKRPAKFDPVDFVNGGEQSQQSGAGHGRVIEHTA